MKVREIEERLRQIVRGAKNGDDKGDVVAAINELVDDLERDRLLAPQEARQ